MIRWRLLVLLIVVVLFSGTVWAEYQYGEVMGSYKGVPARCNGAPVGNGNIQYSCVSYVRLFYRTIYNQELGPVGGQAAYAFDRRYWAGRSDFEAFAQGSQVLPSPDDILCFGGGSYGHVAIVTEVTESSVKVIEQNVSLTDCNGKPLTVERRNGGFYLGKHAGLPVQGWLHYKFAKGAGKALKPKSSAGKGKTSLGQKIKVIKKKLTQPMMIPVAHANSSPTGKGFTGRLPILRGKTEAEIRRLFGTPYKVFTDGGQYMMRFASPPGYISEIEFLFDRSKVARVDIRLKDLKSPLARTASEFLPELILRVPLTDRRMGYDPKTWVLITAGNVGKSYYGVNVFHPTKKLVGNRPKDGRREDFVALDWRTCKVERYEESGAAVIVSWPPGLGISPP